MPQGHAMTILRPAASRGYADHGWLRSYHSFSFARYVDRAHHHFGILRVLNDDFIQANSGFDRHPHDNMEILTYVLSGTLTHEDSMGHRGTIRAGECQYMRAGTGVWHSERNEDAQAPCHLLQLWLYPNVQHARPLYTQSSIHQLQPNALGYKLIAAPEAMAQPHALPLLADAWLWLRHGTQPKSSVYPVKPERMVYVHVIEGCVQILGCELQQGDALMIRREAPFAIHANDHTHYLLFDLPHD
jgi:redox-sensitive bicupin YhaK (pirin superfamily)